MPACPLFRSSARAALGLLILAAAGCGPRVTPITTARWLVGQEEPRFDPTGPADAVRWSLERLLSEGLVAEDSSGRIVSEAARRWEVTPDGLTYTFSLRSDLRFDDGRACTSADFRRALEAGLNRVDHAAYAWMLSSVAGVDQARPGRPLPPLGIATPDNHTLVLRLARPDTSLLHTLALPGVSMPWAEGAGWKGGIGSYRVVLHEPGRRMVLARREARDGPDTVRVEFSVNTARARASMRLGRVELLWPVPRGTLAQALPEDYRAVTGSAHPARRLWLVLRADLHPTRKIEARRALAHGLNRAEILDRLGARASEAGDWLPGGAPFVFPRRDPGSVREWLQRGRFGRSLYVVMAYAADGVAAEVARAMQADWADMALDVELRPLRRAALENQALGRGGAQLLLLEQQAPSDDPVAELARLVQPRRGPPVGEFRTGWSTREFDRWIGPQPPDTLLDIEYAQRRLGEELVALPLAQISWLWVERSNGMIVALHPRYGPGFALRPVVRSP
jgi:ABC-type transport system substrate-binding protein